MLNKSRFIPGGITSIEDAKQAELPSSGGGNKKGTLSGAFEI
jgi:hypothetical protein